MFYASFKFLFLFYLHHFIELVKLDAPQASLGSCTAVDPSLRFTYYHLLYCITLMAFVVNIFTLASLITQKSQVDIIICLGCVCVVNCCCGVNQQAAGCQWDSLKPHEKDKGGFPCVDHIRYSAASHYFSSRISVADWNLAKKAFFCLFFCTCMLLLR